MVFTNKICYDILVQGYNEALECLEMKDFLFTPKGMAYDDHQSSIIIHREGVSDLEAIEKDNHLIVNYRLNEMMKFAFFRFLDRQQELAESKYFINSSEFYRKCLNALNIELTKRNSKLKEITSIKERKKIMLAPFFELDDPDPLQFLSTKKSDLEQRAFKEPCQQSKPEVLQQNKEIEIYLKSYKPHYFSSVIDKRNKEDKENSLFYGKVTASILQQRNNGLLLSEILKEKYNLLSVYNERLCFLTGHTMQLFKAVNDYSITANSGYLTKIKINEDEVFISLNELKKITKSIKHNLLNEEIKTASKIRNYCILMFDDCTDLLKDSFGIDIYKSPLKVHFESVKTAFENSINFDELKSIKELETNTTEALQQRIKPKGTYTPKPCFKPESIQSITDTLNTFFEASQHAELKRIIETGNKATEKLFFRDNGNKLSDYFKILYENKIIIGCAKKDLINWIVENFVFNYRKEQKEFIYKTVEKTISGTAQPCKNPIT